jgi:hypothetical protein
MLTELIFLIKLAGAAVVFADVLVRPGMILEPVQRWLRGWYRAVTTHERLVYFGPDGTESEMRGDELDAKWWWAPLWGCYKCVAGQWGFWGFLLRYHHAYAQGWRTALLNTLPEHLAFTAFTIIAAIIISKWTQE